MRIEYPLAVGKFPVTVGEWKKFIAATGHDTGNSAYVCDGKEWKDTPGRGWASPGFAQDDGHPVTCVNWNDAEAFTAWMAKLTGQSYRLLSEAEWEYACRAGTTSRYAFGDQITSAQANFNRDKGGTSPVGEYPANKFGLQDMHGNVWEWVGTSMLVLCGLANRLMVLRSPKPPAPTASTAVVPGSTTRSTSARPTATGTNPRAGAASSASASPGPFSPLEKLFYASRMR